MANGRLLKDTVILENSIGEVDDVRESQISQLDKCYCVITENTNLGTDGNSSDTTATLYTFDKYTICRGADNYTGTRSFLDKEQFRNAEDKSQYYTFDDNGYDYFSLEGSSKEYKIYSVAHKVQGSKRMWHFEVKGK